MTKVIKVTVSIGMAFCLLLWGLSSTLAQNTAQKGEFEKIFPSAPSELEGKFLNILSSPSQEKVLSYFGGNIALGQLNEKISIEILGRTLDYLDKHPKLEKALVEFFFDTERVPIEAVLPWEFPSGTDIEEYIKGAKPVPGLVQCLPFTGMYGGVVASAAPVLVAEKIIFGCLGLRGNFDVKFVAVDDRDDPSLALAHFENFKRMEPKPLIVSFCSPEGGNAVIPHIKDAGFVNMAVGLSIMSGCYFCENSYSLGLPLLEECPTASMVLWLMMEFPKADVEEFPLNQIPNAKALQETIKAAMDGKRPWKHGYLCVNIPTYLTSLKGGQQSPLAQSILVHEFGIAIGPTETFEFTSPDVTPQLIRLRGAGCESIGVFCVSSAAAIVAKTAKSLGMLENTLFWSSAFMTERSSILMSRGAQTGWVTSIPGVSSDELDRPNPPRGVERVPLLYGLAGTKDAPGDIMAEATNFVPVTLEAIVECLDKVGGWSNYDKIDSDMVEGWIATLNNTTFPWYDMRPVTIIPGKTSLQDNVIVIVDKDGKLRNVAHNSGEIFDWVAHWMVPVVGSKDFRPLLPPPPLDGSPIDYGPPWEQWTFEKFLSTYDVPLWWAILTWGMNTETWRVDKDLFLETLDRYFECKKVVNTEEGGIYGLNEKGTREVDWSSPEKRVEKLQEFLDLYYLPPHWVEWINEYIAKVS